MGTVAKPEEQLGERGRLDLPTHRGARPVGAVDLDVAEVDASASVARGSGTQYPAARASSIRLGAQTVPVA